MNTLKLLERGIPSSFWAEHGLEIFVTFHERLDFGMRLEIGDVIRDVLVFGNKFRIEFLMPLDGVVELEVCNCYVTSHQKLFFPDEI